jgi:hypothetical protein
MGSTVNRRTNRPSRLLFPSLLLGSSLLILACEPEQPEPSDLPRSESAQQGEPTQTGQSLYVTSTKLWSRSGAITEIPVCFENPDPSNDTERGLVRTSVEETWQSVASVRFTGWGPCSATAKGIRLRIQDVGPYTLGLGTDLDGVRDGMSLNFTFSTWSTGCQMTKPYCIRVGAVHEFGHALGFAHEQNRPDTPSWCALEQGSDGDILVGPWDLDSVMNYCNPAWTGDGKLSETDIEGVRAAYGRSSSTVDAALSSGTAFLSAQSQSDAALGSTDQTFFADVTGDGRADLIALTAASGDVFVGKAQAGGSFAALQPWRKDFAPRASKYFFADVTGDGRADAVAFLSATAAWQVAVSSGSSFGTAVVWKTGHGLGSSEQLVGDVTGDGRADAVTFFSATGNFWVAPSSGSSFSTYSQWKADHGAASSSQLLADVTGDGRADAVVFVASTGSWRVAASTGSAFSTSTLWKSGHGVGSSAQLVDDVTGDGKADAVAVFRGTGSIWVAPSTGSSFTTYSRWQKGIGTALSADLNQALIGDVNGDNRADILIRWLH